ncbi:MAG: SDR family NAD(P)-dependent oxidoreductase, partial [Saprospiraceae bacterium]|nr:SDR family NAD(P)-dependent oxidoreductase [Saprospiraceae bacterium]
MKLQSKVAIVTGGAQGMGRAICLRYAQEGANVIVADLNLPGAQKVVDEIAGMGGKAVAVQV